jgi:hypothetical protein
MYSVDVFIRSYSGDFRWLNYALKALHKRARRFGDVHIVVPIGHKEQLSHLTQEKIYECPVYADDYIGQQITKLMADTYCKSDYIMHVDSDLIFTSDVMPENFIVDGKPIIYYEPYSVVGMEPWYPIVSEVLGWNPEHEFMRRFPFVYPRWLYGELRNYLETRYSNTLENYISSRPYRSFSEFNILGEYAWKMHHDKFTWRNPHEDPTYVRQFRSWDGIDQYVDTLEELTK